jgi:Na+/proline symporter
MLAARTENDALFGTFAFQAMHYALRPWPWIVVALASTIVYPTLGDIQARFPHVSPDLLGNDIAYPAMLVFLPAGFAGFMIAGMFAAYRSTIETHLNWGTSYLVHDFYRRIIRPDANEAHYVFAGRVVTVLLMVCGVGVTYALGTAREAFNLLISIGAGTGLIYLLRWFWWRINAWSEIAAMTSSFAIAVTFFVAGKFGHASSSTTILLVTVAFTTAVWLIVTALTPADDEATLEAFYAKVRPAGPGWRRIRVRGGLPPSPDSPAQALGAWVLGLAAIYGVLFATGAFVYGKMVAGAAWGLVAVLAIIALISLFRRGGAISPQIAQD